MQPPLSDMATVAGASRITGVPASTIRKAISEGRLRAWKLQCKTPLVSVSEVLVGRWRVYPLERKRSRHAANHDSDRAH